MARKFVITSRGVLRFGEVRMHKDLLQADDICYGGGFYEFDYGGNRLILTGASYDFGTPRWDRLQGFSIQLQIPSEYRGMAIIYRYDDQTIEPLTLTKEFEISYY
ncbi:MAG: hypothetical protein MJY71_03080 [Bacteroidaceae bacterium]|nr:hypothetical protein [Bacteroidaceae bacterium]